MYGPLFEITPELLRLITEATELKSWIGRSVLDVTWLPVLQREIANRLVHSSTAIEGNPLTLPEVDAITRGEEIQTQIKVRQEVLNYLAALKWIWKRKIHTPVKESHLLLIHRLITHKTIPKDQAGFYKNKDNRIINHKGITIYRPPPYQESPGLTRELLTWINSPKVKELHPIIVSGIAHHRLVSIHPFMDGNGRISRALAIWLLYVRGFDTHHLCALDEFYEENRQKYYQKIQQARELDDNLTFWLEFVAKGVVETLNKTKNRILSLQVDKKGIKMILTKRQEDFLRFLANQGRVKSPDFEKAFKISRVRVNQIIHPLIKAGLVIREGQTRATTYCLA